MRYCDYPHSNPLKIYWASATGCRKISSEQMRLKQIIGGERLVCEWIDITTDTALLHEMRQKSAIEKALPPQIFHGDEYLGNVEALNEAVEDGNLWGFLRLDRQRAVRYREIGGGKYEIVDPTAALVDACFDKMAEEVSQAAVRGEESEPMPAPPVKPAGGVAMPCMGTQSTLRPLDKNLQKSYDRCTK
ncbi:Oidioi.mRNA.OKI2018_I69.XSR.g14964.t2.cds [Oikopleura dioica]|uniref:Oidioi.mRNA.OKI2018_I69.XSR.g14964.t2.cds n=1 Tax=Oikopleura dioica TaxID=34765 RepID=A0ABN7SBD0_OIKDI|nr:Oidioi.mRNA.OKI2018_I69.XSR.g14964.t2.cds [Oikopleura dioica]